MPVEVLREVDHDGDVAGLAGKAGAGTTAENGHIALTAFLNRRDHVVDAAGMTTPIGTCR